MKILNGILNGLWKAIASVGICIISISALVSSDSLQQIKVENEGVFQVLLWLSIIGMISLVGLVMSSKDAIHIEWKHKKMEIKEKNNG